MASPLSRDLRDDDDGLSDILAEAGEEDDDEGHNDDLFLSEEGFLPDEGSERLEGFQLDDESERLEGFLDFEDSEEDDDGDESREEEEDDHDHDEQEQEQGEDDEEEGGERLQEESRKGSFQEDALQGGGGVGGGGDGDGGEEDEAEHGLSSKPGVMLEGGGEEREEEREEGETEEHPANSDLKPEESIEEEVERDKEEAEDDDDNDHDDDITGGDSERLTIQEESDGQDDIEEKEEEEEGEEGLMEKIGNSALTIDSTSDAGLSGPGMEVGIDQFEDHIGAKNLEQEEASLQDSWESSESCKDKAQACLGPDLINDEPHHAKLNQERLLIQEDHHGNASGIDDHSCSSELIHLKLDDFIPLFKSSKFSSSCSDSSSSSSNNNNDSDDVANSNVENSCSDSYLPFAMQPSASLSRSPITGTDSKLDDGEDESIYPLVVIEDKENEISSRVLIESNDIAHHQAPHNPVSAPMYSMDPIIHSPPLSPIMELQSMKRTTKCASFKSLSKACTAKDQNLMRRMSSINHHAAEVFSKESNQQNGFLSSSSSLISKTIRTVKNEGLAKAKPMPKRSTQQTLRKRASSENYSVANHGASITDEVDKCIMVVNHCDGGGGIINVSIEEEDPEAENRNLQLMSISGRISTESYSPCLRQRATLNGPEDHVRKPSLISRSANAANDGAPGKACKVDRVARFAQLQKIWKKDTFLQGIGRDKRPQAQHSFSRVRSSTNPT